MDQLVSVFETLWQIVLNLWTLVVHLLAVAMYGSLLIAWVAWWLWGVNWTKLWPVLARGAWVPAVLLMVVASLVWSRLDPSDCSCLGFVVIANFWWQLGATALLAAVTLFCGWLQGLLHWAPAEIDLNPPAHADTGHGHAHAHH